VNNADIWQVDVREVHAWFGQRAAKKSVHWSALILTG
jgi:hypothetical protein